MTHFPIIIGHRGAAGLAPENTLTGFRLALSYDIDGVECDVHASRDGEAVVLHDATIDRTTKSRGKVRDLTLAELREVDAGEGEYIPSLREVLGLVMRARRKLIIEVKDRKAIAPTLRTIDELSAHADVHIISFDAPTLRRVRHDAPQCTTGRLYHSQKYPIMHTRKLLAEHRAFFSSLLHPIAPHFPFFFARTAQVDEIGMHVNKIHKRLVRHAHDRRLAIYTWGANDATAMRLAADNGVDAFATDFPNLAIQLKKTAYS